MFTTFFLIVGHILTVVGVLFAVVFFSRVRTVEQHPGTTMAWLLAMLFIPYVAIPAYFLIGGRKYRRVARRKGRLQLDKEHPLPDIDGYCPAARMTLQYGGAARVTRGNRLTHIESATDTYAVLMREIAEAKESIHMMTFIVLHDEVAREIVEALAARAREGVKVRLMVDAIGSLFTRGHFLDPLREAGGEVAVFLPALNLRRRWAANLRNHRKIYIFDGKRAIFGGRNIGHVYMGPAPDRRHWQDYCALVEGPAVHNLNEIFAADWRFATGERIRSEFPPQEEHPADGNIVLQTVVSGPDVPDDQFYDQLLAAMFHARSRIWIVTPYFIPDQMILRTLAILSRCGVDVRVYIPRSSEMKIADFVRRYFLRELHRAGAKIYLYKHGMLHTKLLLIDENLASLGSPNMDMRSLHLNFEVAMFVYSEEEAAKFTEYAESLIPESVPFGEMPMGRARAPMRFLENIAHLVAPLL